LCAYRIFQGESENADFVMKKITALFFALFYGLITLLTIVLAVLFKEYCFGIVAGYFVFMAVAVWLNIILYQQMKKRKLDMHKEIVTSIFDKMEIMAVLWYEDFSQIFANSTLAHSTGFSIEELKNKAVLEKILPDEAFSKNGARTLISKKDVHKIVYNADGTQTEIIWNTSLIEGFEGKPVYISVGVDFSKTADMEKKICEFSNDLAETQRRYSLSMELSEIGLILRRGGSNRVFVSQQFKNMLGIDGADVMYVDELKEKIHPSDRVLFENYCEIDAASADSHKIHDIDLRILSADGTYHWYSFRYKVSRDDINGDINIGGAIIDITKEKEKDSLIEKMAYIDEVTQIYNRNRFMMIGQETLECSLDLNLSYWVIVLDIDQFHIINDTCGYENGNNLLKDMAITILKNLTLGGFGARIGGDNFALIVKDDGDEELPVKIIKNIQDDLSKLASGIYANQTISCSAGYCKMPDGSDNFAKVLDHAEFALSFADDSRGTITRYDLKMHDAIIAGNNLEKELALALDNKELVLYYQPKINLSNGEIIGMEALIRWIKPDGTVVPPGAFIPVAESSKLITKISDFVMYEACRQNKEWQDEGLPKLTVSINLTSVDFYQTDIKETIHRVLEETGLEPKYLEIELTESLALKDIEQAIHQMKELKELGVKLSMDDFGTGYSSLSYIQVLPITLLKLDRSFIMYLEEDEVSREIVSAVIKIAKSKKIETIAEGIETVGQAEILKRSGCDLAQGYFFGRPMPAKDFKEFLKSKMPIEV